MPASFIIAGKSWWQYIFPPAGGGRSPSTSSIAGEVAGGIGVPIAELFGVGPESFRQGNNPSGRALTLAGQAADRVTKAADTAARARLRATPILEPVWHRDP